MEGIYRPCRKHRKSYLETLAMKVRRLKTQIERKNLFAE